LQSSDGEISTTEDDRARAAEYNLGSYYRMVNHAARIAYRGEVLRVGSSAPDVALPMLDGERVTLGDIRERRHAVLIFGCYSAPPCVKLLPELEELHRGTSTVAEMVFLYTREIHPNEDFAYGRFANHTSLAQKADYARRLRDDFGLTMAIAVDDLGGSAHAAFGSLPVSAAVVDRRGILVHRSEWASAVQLRAVVENLAVRDGRELAGESPRMSYSETLWCSEYLTKKA